MSHRALVAVNKKSRVDARLSPIALSQAAVRLLELPRRLRRFHLHLTVALEDVATGQVIRAALMPSGRQMSLLTVRANQDGVTGLDLRITDLTYSNSSGEVRSVSSYNY